jgi:hypothetical protein
MSGPSGITVKGPGWKEQQKQPGLDKKGTLSFTPHGPQRNSEHKKDRAGRMGTLVRGIIRPICQSGNSSKTLDPFSKKPLRSKKAGAPYDPGPRRSPRIIAATTKGWACCDGKTVMHEPDPLSQ